MIHNTPFLLFNGNCAEAMTFYHKCFGGDLSLVKTGDTPMKNQFSPEKHNLIINARLKSASIEISATDWHADNVTPVQGNMMSVYVAGDNYNELKSIFDKLSVNADKDKRIFMELRDMPFGTYGQFTDQFQVPWVFVGEKKQ